MLTEIEEKVNEKKTASAETGMMGFYKNFMHKNVGEAADLKEQNEVPKGEKKPQDLRSKMEERLKELKKS